jgi:signal transduction histidine kinase
MSLRAKLLAVFFIGATLTAAGVAGSLFWMQHGDPELRSKRDREAIARFAGEMAREAVLADDPMMLSSHLRSAIAREETLSGARFKLEGDWIPIGDAVPGPVERASVPVEGDEGPSTVDIELNFSAAALERARREELERSARGVVLVLAFVVVFAFPFAWGLARGFTAPLERLIAAIDRVAEGESHEPLPEKRRDELGRVAARFNRMTEKLAQLDAMKDTFVRSVSHDLKAPLSAIESYARRIDDEAAVDEKTKENLSHIATNAKRLREYIVQLLEESRIERGMLDIAPEKFDLAGMVRDTVVFFGPRAHESKMRLSFELPEQSLPVTADPERIQQVFTNLVGNALKFTEPGGNITVYAKRGEEPDTLEAGVIDSGVGIAPEDQERLFKRFERVKNPLKTGGAGLGLAIVKGIVEAHGGGVGVDSKPGSGSRFYFTLPGREQT